MVLLLVVVADAEKEEDAGSKGGGEAMEVAADSDCDTVAMAPLTFACSRSMAVAPAIKAGGA